MIHFYYGTAEIDPLVAKHETSEAKHPGVFLFTVG